MKNNRGVTFLELLIVFAILIIIYGVSTQAFPLFQRAGELSNTTEEIISILRFAQSQTLASQGASQYGVYFDNTTDPHQYTLFKGVDYSDPLRDASSDEIHKIPNSVEIYEINLAGGHQEVVFSRLFGDTNNPGSIFLRLKSDHSKTKTIGIQSSGTITLGVENPPSDSGRIRDTRHLNFEYSPPRPITNETLFLTFYGSSTVTQDIPISSNIVDGQLYWEREVNVNGQNQKIGVHTLFLDNPDTPYNIFSVHRDGRYNDLNIPLEISISGESDYLVEYSDDCLAITQESIYISGIQCQ